MSCEKPSYEQPQAPNVYPVVVDGYRTPSVQSPIPTARLYECFDGQPGTIRASLEGAPDAIGRLSQIGEPTGSIKVIS